MPSLYYWHHSPSEALRPFIDRYWGWNIPTPATLPMLMPGTGSECFFHFSQPPKLHSGQILPESYLVCPRHQITRFLPSEQIRFIAIRFKNGQLRHFTQSPFMELQDSLPSLTVLWGYAAEALYEQLLNASGRDEQIHRIEQFLLSRLRMHYTEVNNSLDQLMEQIYYAPNCRIDSWANKSGWSQRQLERVFKNSFALTPKRFARLARLHHTLRQISLYPDKNVLDIALERGFSDQPHFGHETQALIGMTPRELQPLLRQPLHYYNPPSRTPE